MERNRKWGKERALVNLVKMWHSLLNLSGGRNGPGKVNHAESTRNIAVV